MSNKDYFHNYYLAHKGHDGDLRFKHSKSHDRIYFIWQSMKDRCYNPNNKQYKNYGGRGIKVCDEWKNDFKIFLEWANKNNYDSSLTIDRINVNGDYEPLNCRWTTLKEQQNNKRNNVILAYKGEKHNVTQWADILNIPRSTIYTRLKRKWSIVDALNINGRKEGKYAN